MKLRGYSSQHPTEKVMPRDRRQTLLCPRCEGQDCIAIEIGLQEQDAVQFFSCRDCEMKWWEHEGDTIDLDAVLVLAARNLDRPDPSEV